MYSIVNNLQVVEMFAIVYVLIVKVSDIWLRMYDVSHYEGVLKVQLTFSTKGHEWKTMNI